MIIHIINSIIVININIVIIIPQPSLLEVGEQHTENLICWGGGWVNGQRQ